MIELTNRFQEALASALKCHHGQLRKGTEIPYISHPMGVASLVLEFGGNEDEAIAALLHDVLEDGGAELAPEIEAKFGSVVLTIVRECSDSEPKAGEAKPPWKHRKQAYLDSLPHKSRSALLVTACDKLHNLTAIVRDYRDLGAKVWNRFNSDLDDNVWYYLEMTRKLNELGVPPAKELSVKYAEFCRLMESAKNDSGAPNSSVQVKATPGQLPTLSSERWPIILHAVERHLQEQEAYQGAMELMQKAQAEGRQLSGSEALQIIRRRGRLK